MYPFEKPKFEYNVVLAEELERIKEHQVHRKLPAATSNNLIIATWNLTNFGLQEREDVHLQIMAEILKPYDIVAIQELADNINHLHSLLTYLGDDWDAIYSDVAGNYERLGYLFNSKRVMPTGLAAELAMRGYERQRIAIDDIVEEFEGFNRNPYMISFKADEFEFTMVNVHLYWSSYALRQLETKALSKWAKLRVNKSFPPNNDIILIGDFNMPKLNDNDKIYNLLTENGLYVPKYNTELIGTNLAGDKHYDELAFFPSRTEEDFTNRMGVFDFDKVLFPDLYRENETDFFKYIRYYIADHRPLWAEFYRFHVLINRREKI